MVSEEGVAAEQRSDIFVAEERSRRRGGSDLGGSAVRAVNAPAVK
jgi:hypothetical protein